MATNRSPVCDKALTLRELKAQPAGTRVILFHWHLLGTTDERLLRIWDGKALRYPDGHLYESDPADGGLKPYNRQFGWNRTNCTVLECDARHLPTKEYTG